MVTFSLDDSSGNDVDADRYDIEESFGALDVHKTGRLGFDLAYTLLLGLGYLGNYKKKNDFTPEILKQLMKQIEENDGLLIDGRSNNNNNDEGIELGIKLETLLTIVATHPALQKKSSDNFNFAQIGFELIDHDRKGYVNASDVQRLSNDVGNNIDNNKEVATKISMDEAKAMIETTNDMFAAKNNNNDDGNNNGNGNNNHRLNSVVFQKLFTSPFP
ncbi:hypothetical protein FRACYDRAFT_255226 [Fragilariopsis cylindrus CCMP1102]|uniref:Uncharacterized protein n=1 Tax=Fragilariopsis cylindrus CCMP1102 TaxID=635003 RepID=A0A1E7EL73_9STRA|nr:hypothetical protein FRACYDRAFT_255226 [Fragilariopsis cylindrus CCMP1102]|eukprot:OEU06303.1 hypothetical protein FRACYDRAFT_255226 [Fragilariopsis cylindrus CCMP1102]